MAVPSSDPDVQQTIENDTPVNCQEFFLLYMIAQDCTLETVQNLVGQGCDPFKPLYGITLRTQCMEEVYYCGPVSAIDIAARFNRKSIFEDLLMLLEQRNNPTYASVPTHNTLHFAVLGGDLEIVRRFLGIYPSCINKYDQSGWTALHVASYSGNLDMVKFLLLRGAKSLPTKNDQSTYPIEFAAEFGHEVICTVLMRANDDLHETAIVQCLKSCVFFHLSNVKEMFAGKISVRCVNSENLIGYCLEHKSTELAQYYLDEGGLFNKMSSQYLSDDSNMKISCPSLFDLCLDTIDTVPDLRSVFFGTDVTELEVLQSFVSSFVPKFACNGCGQSFHGPARVERDSILFGSPKETLRHRYCSNTCEVAAIQSSPSTNGNK